VAVVPAVRILSASPSRVTQFGNVTLQIENASYLNSDHLFCHFNDMTFKAFYNELIETQIDEEDGYTISDLSSVNCLIGFLPEISEVRGLVELYDASAQVTSSGNVYLTLAP
jgi:hypothetical protein